MKIRSGRFIQFVPVLVAALFLSLLPGNAKAQGPLNVGYYDMTYNGGEGNPDHVPPILAAGHTPVRMFTLSPAELETVDILLLYNRCYNCTYYGEYMAHLADIEDAVANGMVLIMHDHYVRSADTLPGSGPFTVVSSSSINGGGVDVLDTSTLVTDGPGGVINNGTLDGITTGIDFHVSGAPPTDTKLIFSRTNPSRILTFTYRHGSGSVIYSSINLSHLLLYYPSHAFSTIYAPNVIAYGASLVATNAAPTADAGPDASGDEGSSIALDGDASDPDGDDLTFTWSVDDPVLCSFDNPNALDPNITCTDNGTFMVTLTADDGNGGVSADTATVTVNNVVPQVVSMAFPAGDTVELGTSVVLEASFSDPGDNDTHTAVVDWGDTGATCQNGPQYPVDPNTNTVTASHDYAEAGVYLVHICIIDDDVDDGKGGKAGYPYVVVWDPNAGFVTGNGAVKPDAAGEFSKDETLKGKTGDFGFVSKPRNDGTLLGKAQYRISDNTGVLLDFVSLSQEWLVIAGEQAIFQGGQGTIGGQMDADGGYYQFFISVIDGKYTGDPNKTDYFRIQIKDSQGSLVYDTQYTALMSADATTPLTSGKIFIRHNYAAGESENGLIIVGSPPAELLDALLDPGPPAEDANIQLFLPSLNS